MTSALQFGHGAVSPIWSRVAERCWPHVGHANLTNAADGGGNGRGFRNGDRRIAVWAADCHADLSACRGEVSTALWTREPESIASGRRLEWEFTEISRFQTASPTPTTTFAVAAPLLFPRKPHECLSGAAPDFYIGLRLIIGTSL